jgi:hypothetical protein
MLPLLGKDSCVLLYQCQKIYLLHRPPSLLVKYHTIFFFRSTFEKKNIPSTASSFSQGKFYKPLHGSKITFLATCRLFKSARTVLTLGSATALLREP